MPREEGMSYEIAITACQENRALIGPAPLDSSKQDAINYNLSMAIEGLAKALQQDMVLIRSALSQSQRGR